MVMRFGLLVIGIVLGAMLRQPIEDLARTIQDYRCGTDAVLREAGRLREQAVQLELEASRLGNASLADSMALPRHQKANALYDQLAKCGSPLALAQLGLAHCAGYAVSTDKDKGLTLIREASLGIPVAATERAIEVCLEPRKGTSGVFQARF
jgi:hypothetical protein